MKQRAPLGRAPQEPPAALLPTDLWPSAAYRSFAEVETHVRITQYIILIFMIIA